MTYLAGQGRYLVVAGSRDDRREPALYSWSGAPDHKPQPLAGIDLNDMNPEAIAVYPARQEFLLLSDDGGRQVQDDNCKNAAAGSRSFRSLRVPLP